MALLHDPFRGDDPDPDLSCYCGEPGPCPQCLDCGEWPGCCCGSCACGAGPGCQQRTCFGCAARYADFCEAQR